ncbi:MAG: hypothetical protein HYR55_09780 [Acidobacteria bacterium]|nr:hypothetical protein [Acidobacteriota bacterium]MBI3657541.1 hypothetical protein [Acidobacteriota bacterium]
MKNLGPVRQITFISFLLLMTIFIGQPVCAGTGEEIELVGRVVNVEGCGCVFYTGYSVGQGDPYEIIISPEATEIFEQRCAMAESSTRTHVNIIGTLTGKDGECGLAPALEILEYRWHH